MFGSTLDQSGETEPGCKHSISSGCNSRRAVAVVAAASTGFQYVLPSIFYYLSDNMLEFIS